MVLPHSTPRLVLRRFQRADAGAMLPLIGDFAIADTTARIPHPYTMDDARNFLDMLEADPQRPIVCVALADGTLVGAVGLELEPAHDRGELGYWIGKPFWGRGYATEAAAAMLEIAFGEVGLNKVIAHHFARNPASGRVLEKIGMRREGVLRAHMKRWDRYEDCVAYGITAREFQEQAHGQGSAAADVG